MKRLILLALAFSLSGCASQFGMRSQPAPLPAKPVHVITTKQAIERIAGRSDGLSSPTPQVSVVVTSIPPAKALRLLDRIKNRFHHKKGDVK